MKNIFENKEVKKSLKEWLDSDYKNTSSYPNIDKIFKNEYLGIVEKLFDKKNKEKLSKNDYFDKSTFIIHNFSNNPWTSQKEVLISLNIPNQELSFLNLITSIKTII